MTVFKCMFPNDYHDCEPDLCNPELDCPIKQLNRSLDWVEWLLHVATGTIISLENFIDPDKIGRAKK